MSELASELEVDEAPPDLEPRWNVAPTQPVPVVRELPDGRRRLDLVRWGLVPPWAPDPSQGARLINARAETAARTPAFRKAFAARRCLVAADGFYEWRRDGRRRVPFHVRRRDGRPFAMAGLWERWRAAAGGEPLETCAVLTTEANELVAPIHERMPVILARADLAGWLDPDAARADLEALLRPLPPGELVLVEASPWVNDVRHEGAACLEPPPREPPPAQADLFEPPD